MTQDEIKKRLECVAKITGNDLIVDAYKIITEQEKSLQEAQDSILFLMQQNQEYREQQVKQAKIDMLNEVKKRLDGVPNGWAYTTYIDELIKEVKER